MSYTLFAFYGFIFYVALSCLEQSILFWKVLIINICNGISKPPSTWRSPLHTLPQTGFEVLQHIILGNERHSLFEVILHRSVILLPHVTIVACKLTSVLNITKHQICQLICRWLQLLKI